MNRVTERNLVALARMRGSVGYVYFDESGATAVPSVGGGPADTDDLPEGVTNLYHTDERVRDVIGATLVAGTGMTVTVDDGADTITLDAAPGYTDEQVRDTVAATLVAGSNVTITPNDLGDTITISAVGGDSTTDLPLAVQPFIPRGAWTFQWPVWQATGAENSGIPTTGTNMGTLGSVSSAGPVHSIYDLTTTFRRQPRRRYTSTASAGSAAGSRNAAVYLCGAGGYAYALRFGFADPAFVATARSFIGVRASTAGVANVDPSTFIDCVGVGADSGDTNLHLLHNDSTGLCTKVDLGANFPANTSDTDFYELQIYCAPGGSTIQVHLRNLTNGASTLQLVTTNIPTPTTGLGYVFWRNNGTTALVVDIHFGTQSVALSLE